MVTTLAEVQVGVNGFVRLPAVTGITVGRSRRLLYT